MSIKKMISTLMAALLLAGPAAGCGAETGLDSAAAVDRGERLLSRFLTVLENEKPPVRATGMEVIVEGVAVPVLDGGELDSLPAAWEDDPYEAVRFLKLADKTVSAPKREQAKLGLEEIRVTVNPQAWTSLVRDAWRERLAALEAAGPELIQQQISKVPNQNAAPLNRELSGSLEMAREKLSLLVDTLEAEGTCIIELRESGSKPERLIIENRMRFEEGGAVREETVRTTYDFQENGSGG